VIPLNLPPSNRNKMRGKTHRNPRTPLRESISGGKKHSPRTPTQVNEWGYNNDLPRLTDSKTYLPPSYGETIKHSEISPPPRSTLRAIYPCPTSIAQAYFSRQVVLTVLTNASIESTPSRILPLQLTFRTQISNPTYATLHPIAS